jgi:hypothetical protein
MKMTLTTIEQKLDYGKFKSYEMLYIGWMDKGIDVGSFEGHIFSAIKLADIKGRRKLVKGFPYEVLAYFSWFYKEMTEERLEQIEKENGIKFIVDGLPRTKLFHKVGSPENLRKKISATWNEMVDNQSEEEIVEFLVNSQHGVYMPQQLGIALDVEELKHRDPYSEGYWDWWHHEIQPTIDRDLEKLLEEIKYPDSTLSVIDIHPKELAFTIDYHENGDMCLMMMLPEGYWEEKKK